jgi:type IV secretion system protein VirB9
VKRKCLLLIFVAALASATGFADGAARLVKYHANDIIAIKAKLRYTTLIELPPTEKILAAASGDKDFWVIDVTQNFCFLHPAKSGIHSNLNLITDKGNVYSFILDEVTGDPDLKVIIEPSDGSAVNTSASIGPKFVSAEELDSYKAQLQTVKLQADDAVNRFRSDYPTKGVKFDYRYKDEKPFNIMALYHDDRFTYIKSDAAEKFAVYEIKDGKPNLVEFQLKDGTYVLSKIVDKGYFEIGKKHLSFERKQ